MEKTNESFESYLSGLKEEDRQVMQRLDEMLVPKFGKDNRDLWEGVFWGGSTQQIVGYGPYQFKPGAEWFTVGVSVQKNYYSIYCNTVEDKQYLVKAYADRLGKVKTGSSSISFTKLEKLNLDVFAEMVDISHKHWLEESQK